jgi:hypothetical protein
MDKAVGRVEGVQKPRFIVKAAHLPLKIELRRTRVMQWRGSLSIKMPGPV